MPSPPVLPADDSSPSTPITTESNAPGTLAPPRPAPPPPVLPAVGSSNGSGSPLPATPPTVDPVIPITPPAAVGSGPGSTTSPPVTTPPTSPRDWSDLPSNVGNEHSAIGSHAPSVNYFRSDVAFANLIYASVDGPASLVRGLNNQGRQFFGSERYLDWTGPAYYSRDGWPYRSDAGPLSPSNAVHINLVWAGPERMWSVLGLRGGFESPPEATLNENGRSVRYDAPRGIAGRSFSFKATCYWEGQGVAVVGRGQVPPTPTVQSVNFTGPDGRGPFGDGPRTMQSSTVQFTVNGDSPGGLLAYIIESDSTGADPLRNLVVLISEVRDTATGELVYGGFDHTTYRPFQLYPDWVESMRHCSHLRSLHNDFARGEPTPNHIIHEDTGLEYEWHMASHGSTHILTTGWSRSSPSAPGFERGFAAINRPTHVGFGNSLRAIIEICNQLDADLWWCHPAPTVFVGTRHSNGSIHFARLRGETQSDLNQVGAILVDHEYLDGFTHEISTHLKPGLTVYSEWVNEIWNAAPYYVWATRYAWTSAMRAIAPVEYGGDDGLWFSKRTLESPALHAGVDLKDDANAAMAAFSAAASASLAEGIRERLGPESDREIVCVAAGQSNWPARSAIGLGQFWASMPYLFKQLDAVAHAPYRDPILVWPHNSAETDQYLVEMLSTAEGAWDAYEAAGMILPPSHPSSWWTTATRPDGVTNLTHGNFIAWKHLALDLPVDLGADRRNSYARMYVPRDWPANKRRWNLDLLTYEGGTHTLPGNKPGPYAERAKLLTYSLVLEPRNAVFYQRYLETVFHLGPKGLTRDPTSGLEEALYRPGMVPDGVVADAAPLHSGFTFLLTTGQPSFRHGMFWSLQWWNGHVNAAPALGVSRYLQSQHR